jgi:hypothetical protein
VFRSLTDLAVLVLLSEMLRTPGAALRVLPLAGLLFSG